jgi:hypothetical protein
MSPRHAALLLATAFALTLAPIAAHAALDAPSVSVVAVGHGKISMNVTAGPSGLPNGFAVYWMKQTEYDDYGSVWPDQLTYPTLHWAQFTGAPVLNTGGGAYTTFKLGPGETINVQVGDLFDEGGLTTNDAEELEYSSSFGTDYVVCAYAIGGTGGSRSGYSVNLYGTTTSPVNCTYTLGFWKTHPDAWGTVTSLTLGTVSYTKTQLLSILNQAVVGNGLVSLAHQLIAAKLNILVNGADPSAVSATITAADAQIGGLVVPPVGSGFLAPSATNSKTQILDDYNNGITGPGHCGDTPAQSTTWGKIKTLYR